MRSLVDEVPFDIPDSWEWVRLSQIALVLNGDRGKNYPSKEKLVSSGIPFISALNLDGRTVRFLYKGIIINHNKNRANLH